MTTPEPTTTALPLLRLMWLASAALPVGGFSYSEGLESAVDSGLVRDEATACNWLVDQLHLVAARSDMPLLRHALQAWTERDEAAVRRFNDWTLHTRESREMRLQAEQMGRSLTDWLTQRARAADHAQLAAVRLLKALPGGPTWTVAYALAGELAGAQAPELLQAWAFGWAENQVQAAIKCVPLGQSAGQRILGTLVDEIPAAVQRALACSAVDCTAFAPGLAIFSARHEQQYSRLFRS